MLHVGVPEGTRPELLSNFPSQVAVVPVPETLEVDLPQVEFWVPSLRPRHALAQLPRLPGLKVIQSLYAGVDWLVASVPPGVTLCDGRGVHDIPVAEWVLAMILAERKRLPFFFAEQQAGRWSHGEVRELAGSVVLVVGYGSIGRAVEERLRGFDVHLLRIARTARDGVASIAELPRLLPEADIVVLLTPLTPETRHLFDAAMLARMKPGALLVNAARGPVVDTGALVAALEAGRIHAAVDVTDPEPPPAGHPLWRAPHLLLTPHIGGSSARFLERAYTLVAAQLRRCLRHEPLENVVHGAY